MSRWTLLLAGVVGIVIGAVAMVFGGGLVGVSTGDRARVEGIVHDYLIAHPEVLPEAIEALHDKEHAAVIADNRRAILEPIGNAWAGAKTPDLTIVEYFDYNCGYCRASLPVIDQLLAGDPKLRIVYREFPVLADSSSQAARMSLAAADQGKFRAFHDALYAAGPVSAETIAAAAKAAGLDAARAAAFAPKADAEIASNMSIAQQLKLTGTPSWVIGNRVVSSALPLPELQRLVARARARS